MKKHECDVLLIGGGITAAQFAKRLVEKKPGLRVTIVEAGLRFFDFDARTSQRDRWLAYGENPWPHDFIEDQAAEGIISRSMAVGGSAMHWGGVTNRFSEEDTRLHSKFGLATDWPIEWAELERYYCDAERQLGVSGEPSPIPQDMRSAPYPMPPMTLSHNLKVLKAWAEKSGIPFGGTPQAKNTREYDDRGICQRCNTCEICPTGARYSPDFTFEKLLDRKKIELHDETQIRRLVLHDTKDHVVRAEAVSRKTGEEITYEAATFIVTSGYTWSSHLLLLSANSRFPDGLANRSGLVGRYMTGHSFSSAFIELDAKLFPGMNEQHSLISREFFRAPAGKPYVRHDLRVWESAYGRGPRLRDDAGTVMFGDALLSDWRARTKRGVARVRAYYDVHPDRDSRLTLDPTKKNKFGDPLPKIEHRLDAATLARRESTLSHIHGVFETLARADNGKILSTSESNYLDHPGGGCRMGADPKASVVDSYGLTHDHPNLWVVGSPTLPTGGCTNGTLTFVAVTLRSADRLATGKG
ncbi:MAG: GMC family oxidoreductase [Vicinamibacteria bacterium]